MFVFLNFVAYYFFGGAKVVKKSHMRKGYAIFSCKVYGVKCRGGASIILPVCGAKPII